LPLLKLKSLLKLKNLLKLKSLLNPPRMEHLDGHALHIQEDFQGPLFLSNPMEPCAVQQITPSILKSADLSGMAPYASCMQRVLVIVVAVLSARFVKKTEQPRRNRDGSVP